MRVLIVRSCKKIKIKRYDKSCSKEHSYHAQNKTTTSLSPEQSSGISTSAHTKDLVIIAKRNTTQENKHKQKGKLEIKYLTCLLSKQIIKEVIDKQSNKHPKHVKANN